MASEFDFFPVNLNIVAVAFDFNETKPSLLLVELSTCSKQCNHESQLTDEKLNEHELHRLERISKLQMT